MVRYAYDAQGRLTGVADRAGEWVRCFTWHNDGPGAGLMASHTLPTGLECRYEWSAFADHPRVIRHSTSDGQRWQAAYVVGEDGGTTTVTDQRGRIQCWAWNARAQITAYTDAIGRRTSLAWNEAGLLAASTLPNGGVFSYAYDERGNVVAETDPLGRTASTVWRLDAPLPVSETDPAGRTRRYEYDDKFNLIAEDGTAGRTEIGRDAHGQPLSVTDPRGGVTRWAWHASGQVALHEDCSGRQTRYDFDALGQPATLTDAEGHTTTFRHDDCGRLDKLTLADGSTRHWRWLPDNILAAQADGLGQITRYTWTAQGQLASRVDALGQRVEYEYDPSGALSMLFNENGQVYQFDRDAAGQLTAQTGLDGLRTEYTLDALGLPVAVRQAARTPDEVTLRLERDVLGRLLSKTTPETITRYTYDAASQLSRIVRLSRKPDGTPDAPIDALDFVYDLRGNLVEETSTQYQSNGKVLAEPRTRTLRHEHDVLGNRTATELPQGRSLNYLYYGSGHLHQINLDGELVSDIERDATHREINRSQGALLSDFQRDALGRVTGYRAHFGRDASGVLGTSSGIAPFPAPGEATLQRMNERLSGDVVLKGFAYDANGEVAKRVDPLLGERQYAYDAVGRITGARSSANAAQAKHVTAVREEHFAWDAASNLQDPAIRHATTLHNRITAFGNRRYEYDRLGRLTTKRIGHHTVIKLRWNSENQLVESETRRTGTLLRTRYEYDAIGRRVAKHDNFGSTFFTWEGMRLIQEERGTTVATHVYEPGSYAPLARIDLHTDPVKLARHPDEKHLPTAKVYYLHNNVNGAPEEMTDGRGALIWQARYAVWGNTVVEHWHRHHAPDTSGLSATHPLPQNIRMQGQYADAETGLCYNTFRYYDADIGSFISPDPIGLAGGLNLYRYAPNPLAWVDPWGWALTPLNDPGYTTYGLYHQGATDPYYVGHTKQTLDARGAQHAETGRLQRQHGDEIRPLERDQTYTQAKGSEQAYREKYKTKGKFPANVIEPINKNRTDARGKSHYKNYRATAKSIGIKPTRGCV